MDYIIAALPNWLRAFGITRKGRTGSRWQDLALVGFAYLAVALLVRGGTLGFPVIHIDEQFYLLVGDRMLHGAIPFIDIWDRKPIGLFLLFAGMRLLGGDGILQYQLVALACAAGTSLVIYRIATTVTSRAGAWWAGVGYQLYLSAFYCFGGQAPVYYNLLVALAGLGMIRIWSAPTDRRLLLHGLAVMALIGVAIQIKYTVVFEGAAFGLALIARAHRAEWPRHRIALAAILWAGLALAPTLAAWGTYIAMGYGQEFAQANFLSIFGRHEEFSGSLFRLFKETLALSPVWCALFLAPRRIPALRAPASAELGFLRYWACAAVLGFLLFGTWYDHYVAPLLVPLMALAAPALGRQRPWRWYTRFLIGLGIAASAVVTIYNTRLHGTSAEVATAAELIHSASLTPQGQGCVYINEGDPILYHLTGACLTTPFIFPNHLNGMVDAYALGVDVKAEVTRILNTRPQVVVMTVKPSSMPVNWQTRHMIFDRLKQDYELYSLTNVGWRGLLIYRLKAPHAAPIATTAPARHP